MLNQEVKQHEEKCTLREVECPGCRKMFRMEEVSQHEKECEQVEVYCELCEGRFNRRGLRSHPIQECMVSTIRELKRENRKLWEENIRLKMNVEKIEEALENFESRTSTLTKQRNPGRSPRR